MLIAILWVAAHLAGCASNDNKYLPPYVPPEPLASYLISSGDEIEVKFYYAPELNDRFFVPPDGKISLQLMGTIQAAGVTAEQLSNAITEACAPNLEHPEATVVLRMLHSRKVYVGGEVYLPGVVEMTGPLTVPQAIFVAGSAKDTADLSQVVIISRGPDGKAQHRALDLAAYMQGKASEDGEVGEELELLRLQISDVVYVPKSRIAELDLWVDQYLRQMSPILLQAGVFFNHDF